MPLGAVLLRSAHRRNQTVGISIEDRNRIRAGKTNVGLIRASKCHIHRLAAGSGINSVRDDPLRR